MYLSLWPLFFLESDENGTRTYLDILLTNIGVEYSGNLKFLSIRKIIYNIKKPGGRVRFACNKDENLIIDFVSPNALLCC